MDLPEVALSSRVPALSDEQGPAAVWAAPAEQAAGGCGWGPARAWAVLRPCLLPPPPTPSGVMLSRLCLGSREPRHPDAVSCPRPPGSAVTAHTRAFGVQPALGSLNNKFVGSQFWRQSPKSRCCRAGSSLGCRVSPRFGGSRLPPVVTRHTTCVVPVSACPLCRRIPTSPVGRGPVHYSVALWQLTMSAAVVSK